MSVKQKLSFIIKNARGGREEVYFVVWKKCTLLTQLAVIDKDLRGIYSRIDVSSSIAHICLLVLAQNTTKKQQLNLRFC